MHGLLKGLPGLWLCGLYAPVSSASVYTSNFSLSIVTQEVKHNKICENGDKNKNIINDTILTFNYNLLIL